MQSWGRSPKKRVAGRSSWDKQPRKHSRRHAHGGGHGGGHNDDGGQGAQSMTLGVCALVGAAICTAFASVYFERMLKV